MYVITTRGMNTMKIGVSFNPARRMVGLQTSSPVPLEIFAVVPSGGTKLERSFHREMSRFRTHGEWFEMTPESMAKLDSLLSSHDVLDAKAFAVFELPPQPPRSTLHPKPPPTPFIPEEISIPHGQQEINQEKYSRDMKDIRARRDIPVGAILLYSVLLDLDINFGCYDASDSQLAKLVNASTRSIRKHRKILESNGLIPTPGSSLPLEEEIDPQTLRWFGPPPASP